MKINIDNNRAYYLVNLIDHLGMCECALLCQYFAGFINITNVALCNAGRSSDAGDSSWRDGTPRYTATARSSRCKVHNIAAIT